MIPPVLRPFIDKHGSLTWLGLFIVIAGLILLFVVVGNTQDCRDSLTVYWDAGGREYLSHPAFWHDSRDGQAWVEYSSDTLYWGFHDFTGKFPDQIAMLALADSIQGSYAFEVLAHQSLGQGRVLAIDWKEVQALIKAKQIVVSSVHLLLPDTETSTRRGYMIPVSDQRPIHRLFTCIQESR